MNAEEIIQNIEPWLTKQQRAAWKPLTEAGDGAAHASKFGGTPWIGADSPSPHCTVCKKPMSLFVQLDLNALPEELNAQFGTGLLQLFYCMGPDCEGGWEPFENTVSCARVVQPNGPCLADATLLSTDQIPPKRIVGWNRFVDLPSPAEHDQLGLLYAYDFKAGTLRLQCPELDFDVTYPMDDCPAEDIALSELGDKLAGWPHWVQGVEYPNCPRCGTQMIHLFQVDSEDNVPYMFGDAGCGHITQCPNHNDVVAFGWACG